MKTQYTDRVDAVVYSQIVKDFTKEDWAALALACVDQAGVNRYTITDLAKTLDFYNPFSDAMWAVVDRLFGDKS